MRGNFKDEGVQCKGGYETPRTCVVQRLISVNPGLNFSPGSFFFCSKAFPQILFPILFIKKSIQSSNCRPKELN